MSLNTLSACPDCSADPKLHCNVDISSDRWQTNLHLIDKRTVTMTCKICGFKISIVTNKDLKIIRKLWNDMSNK